MNDPTLKYAVLGDIHANLEALTAVLEDARHQGCTRHVCVGDIVGYNASPGECLEVVRGLGMPSVKGNHDEYASNTAGLENLSPRAAAAILWTRQRLDEPDKQWLHELKFVRNIDGFSIVHATLDAPERWGYVFDRLTAAASFVYQNTQVCFYGHTHLPMVFARDGAVRGGAFSIIQVEPGVRYLVNVGSVGEPRDGSCLASYVVYDPGRRSIELRRIPFDHATAEAKVRAAGLPLRRPR